MLRKVLGTVLLLSVAGVACDDDDPPRPRDASADSRRDSGTDARDGASDRMPDTRLPDAGAVDAPAVDAPAVDAPPDTASDRPADTAVDAPPDTVPADTALPDTATPDTALPDTALPDTAPPDTAAPDTAIDTLAPDTTPADAQPFEPLNGCTDEADFEDATDEDQFFLDWANDFADPICIKIRAGTAVVWGVADGQTFATLPVAKFPAAPPSPITGKNTADGEPYEVEFPNPGTFGFHCPLNAGTMETMAGAVWVVP